MVVRKDKVDAHKSMEVICPRETRRGLYNTPSNRNECITKITKEIRMRAFFSYETQLDTSMGSPGVTGISNGVVKPDTEVDDGTDISMVSLVVVLVVAPCVIFLRKS